MSGIQSQNCICIRHAPSSGNSWKWKQEGDKTPLQIGCKCCICFATLNKNAKRPRTARLANIEYLLALQSWGVSHSSRAQFYEAVCQVLVFQLNCMSTLQTYAIIWQVLQTNYFFKAHRWGMGFHWADGCRLKSCFYEVHSHLKSFDLNSWKGQIPVTTGLSCNVAFAQALSEWVIFPSWSLIKPLYICSENLPLDFDHVLCLASFQKSVKIGTPIRVELFKQSS